MTPEACLRLAVTPALSLLPPALDTPEARAMLVAIALQESALMHRRQVRGPARGYWQFEIGGLSGVLKHAASRPLMAAVVSELGYSDATPTELHAALEHNDVLACCAARCLLFTHPKPIPGRHDAQAAWSYYEWLWRPGKPRPAPWPGHFARAWEAV